MLTRPEAASTRYRAVQFIPHLEQAGATVAVEPIPRGWWARRRLFRMAAEFDTVLAQKRLLPTWQVALLRRRARRLVYDFDDAVTFRDSGRGGAPSWTRRRRFRAIVRAADLVIAGNAYLEGLAAPFAKDVVVIPTSLDASKYERAADEVSSRPRETVKLGWIGSGSTLRYLEALREALEDVAAERPAARLKIVCNAFLDLRRMGVEKKPWREEEEAADIADMDIGLAPAAEDPWTLGKCGLKILQYFAASRPVIASPVGVHCDLVRDGVNGVWARTAEEWRQAILRLMDSPEERARMGAEGHADLTQSYALDVVAPRLVQAVLGPCSATADPPAP